MKNLWIIYLSLLFVNCGTRELRTAIKSQKIDVVNGTFVSDSEKLIMPVTINGKSVSFLFDTGANSTILNNPDLVKDVSNVYSFGDLTLVDNSKAKSVMMAVDYQDPILHAENYLIHVNYPPQLDCPFFTEFEGISGFSRHIYRQSCVEINYSQNRVSAFDASEFYRRKSSDYFEVPIKIKQGRVWLGLIINGKEVYHLFDTGNSSAVIWPREIELGHLIKNPYRVNGSAFSSLNNVIENDYSLSGTVVMKLGSKTISADVIETSSVRSPNIGTQFVAQYDWLFDFKNKRAFAKKNGKSFPIQYEGRIAFNVVNGKLVVVAAGESVTRLKLKDEITAINGEPITPENVCEWQSKLNNTKDYSNLVFETKT